MGDAFWHRVRGHTQIRKERHVDTSTRNAYGGIEIESGLIEYWTLCSCGTKWRRY